MFKKLAYGYVLLNVVILVHGMRQPHTPGHGTARLLTWAIIAALTVWLYRRSPRLRARVGKIRSWVSRAHRPAAAPSHADRTPFTV